MSDRKPGDSHNCTKWMRGQKRFAVRAFRRGARELCAALRARIGAQSCFCSSVMLKEIIFALKKTINKKILLPKKYLCFSVS